MEVRLDRGEVGKSVEKKQNLWIPSRNGNFDGFSNFRRKKKKKTIRTRKLHPRPPQQYDFHIEYN